MNYIVERIKNKKISDDNPGSVLQNLMKGSSLESWTIGGVLVRGERNDKVGTSHQYRGFVLAGLTGDPRQVCNTRNTVGRTFQVH